LKFNKINHHTPVKTEILTAVPAPGPVFIQKNDSGSCSSFGKNRRLLPDSTPALRLRDHLCWGHPWETSQVGVF